MDAYMYIQAMHKGAFVQVAEVDSECVYIYAFMHAYMHA